MQDRYNKLFKNVCYPTKCRERRVSLDTWKPKVKTLMILKLKFLLTHIALLDFTVYSYWRVIIHKCTCWCHSVKDGFLFDFSKAVLWQGPLFKIYINKTENELEFNKEKQQIAIVKIYGGGSLMRGLFPGWWLNADLMAFC